MNSLKSSACTTAATATATEASAKSSAEATSAHAASNDGATAKTSALAIAVGLVAPHNVSAVFALIGHLVNLAPHTILYLHTLATTHQRTIGLALGAAIVHGQQQNDQADKDPKTGKLKLSRKALLPKPEGYVEPAERPARPRGDKPSGDRKGHHRPDKRDKK